MNFVSVFIIVSICSLIIIYLNNQRINIEYITSEKDGNEYIVRNLPDKQEAADRLAEIRKRLLIIKKKCISRLPKNKKFAISQLKNFTADNIGEKIDNSDSTAYSVNKGEQIIFCLRSRNSENILHDINLLMFVAIHELAHVITETIGHTEEFKENNIWLLEQAIELGLYKKHNFNDEPKEYCGLNITNQPYKT